MRSDSRIRSWIAAGIVLTGAAIILSCSGTEKGGEAADADGGAERVRVAVSLFPLYEFASRVGGNHVVVTMIVPPGVEPHSYEPAPGDIKLLNNADLIVYNGAGMEPWMDQIIARARPGKARIIEVSAGLELILADEREQEESATHDHELTHDEDHDHGGYNPHTWLNPINAVDQVAAIERALMDIDPEHAAEYQRNAEAFAAELKALDARLEATLQTCARRDVVITHASLTYFCRRYGLKEIPISGLVHQSEPSPRALAALTSLARERGVRAVFHEMEVSPRLAEAVAREIGGKVLAFDTLHTGRLEDLDAGRGYVAIMLENLSQLCRGLECDCEIVYRGI